MCNLMAVVGEVKGPMERTPTMLRSQEMLSRVNDISTGT